MKAKFTFLITVLSLCVFCISCDKDPYSWSEDATDEQKIVIRKIVENMITLEGGTFWMGAQRSDVNGQNYDVNATPDESPVHQVTLSDYFICKYEVTQAEWYAIMGTNPSYFNGDNLPVENVSWNKMQEFILKLNNLSGRTFQLPTEAEWEYAARGGNNSNGYKFSGSNNIDQVAWYANNSSSTTHSVGTKQPNELGIFDMSGNVWEFCQDFKSGYSSSSQTNPQGPTNGTERVLRGGNWSGGDEVVCRISFREGTSPSGYDAAMGFRLKLVE